ncbi:MAG: response regulator transcription factor, partial [Spirochaetota bacterium]
MRVFIVEDNELIRDAVKEYFEVSGYEVAAFENLEHARDAFRHQNPDIVILDVMLPDGNGFQFAKEIRREKKVPILFLTAKEQESDRIMGFEVGGDDYVVKPFSNKELLLRVKALLRRSYSEDVNTDKGDVTNWKRGPESLTIDTRA